VPHHSNHAGFMLACVDLRGPALQSSAAGPRGETKTGREQARLWLSKKVLTLGPGEFQTRG
jgi:hypothetical protein